MSIEVRADNTQIVIKFFGTDYWFQKNDAIELVEALKISIDQVISNEKNRNNCINHEWVSMKNEYIESGEMCLTCYQDGESRVPIRTERIET